MPLPPVPEAEFLPAFVKGMCDAMEGCCGVANTSFNCAGCEAEIPYLFDEKWHGDCEGELRCNSLSGRCAPPALRGESCGDDWDCKSLHCVQGACVVQLDAPTCHSG